MSNIVKSLLTEYGVKWSINRALYSAKLKTLSVAPVTEFLYEKDVSVKRIDLFDFNVKELTTFLNGLSDEKKSEIISTADKAINGVIKGFSSIELNFGAPINWHLNPITGKESRDDLKWYKIPDFDPELGDIKVVWEASRLTHFFYFVRAYLLTGDMKYYRAFSEQLNDWLKNNPYPYGANFKCGQECTLRMINVLMTFSIFSSLGVANDSDRKNVMSLTERCYKKVLSNFFYAHKCIKNNHTFTEICGLIVGAWCSEDSKSLEKSYKLFDQEIRNQFLEDGGFTQYSFNYHRFTLQIIECVYKISEKTQIYITETDRIKNSVLLLYQLQDVNGDVPNYGSNDGALIFPVTSCGYRDFRPVLNTVYALIEGKRIYEPGDYDEELIWFGKGTNLPLEKIERKSVSFKESGYFKFQHQNGFLVTHLQDFKSRPAHMDQLHVDVWHKGINIFCDSGTYSYASDLERELTWTSGHNTARISNREQMNKKGAFFVTDWSDREDIHFDENLFEGKMISKNGYEHQRKIKKSGNSYEITDNLAGDGEYGEFFFNTPCKVRLTDIGFELYNEKGILCIVEISGPIEDVVIEESYRSLYYLRKEKMNRVKVRGKIKNRKCTMKFKIKLM